MKRFAAILIVSGIAGGCLSIPGMGGEPAGLVTFLQARDRNRVHVALVTLQTNDYEVSDDIDFKQPYAQSKPHIDVLVARIKTLDPEARRQIESSFRRHLRIYNPMFKTMKWK
ncbi:MAG: hypothetical protein QF773_01025 [Lentisphaeria bacterium]|jgi:hypothetical protein|nr:hypothetical protein [Lentisphaeria bacterium]